MARESYYTEDGVWQGRAVSRPPKLSSAARKRLEEYKEFQVPHERPCWDTFFMGRAFDVAKRSHDAQTKVGCVFVRDNKELVTGYNGFPRDFDDSVLPNMRDETGRLKAKYEWMVHSEANGICNAAYNGTSLKGSKVYVTNLTCEYCTMLMRQAGVVEVIHAGRPHKAAETEDYVVFMEIFKHLAFGKMLFREMTFPGV